MFNFAMVVVGLLFTAFFLWFLAGYRRRHVMLSYLASRLRMHFFPKDSLSLREKFSTSHLASRGHSCRITNVIHGKRGVYDIICFDWRYETASGLDRNIHRRTVVSCCANWNVPCIIALSKTVSDIGKATGTIVANGAAENGDKLALTGRFSNYTEFCTSSSILTGRYRLYSTDPARAKCLFNNNFCQQITSFSNIDWEICNGYILIESAQLLNALEIARFIRGIVNCVRNWQLS